MSRALIGLVASLVLALPVAAHAAVHGAGRLTPAVVFSDAAPLQKLVMVLLIIAVPAVIVAAATRRGGEFISGLRLGGPMLGLLGAVYSALSGAIGAANIHPTDPNVFAPGIAESLLVLGLGLLAGLAAVVAHGMTQART